MIKFTDKIKSGIVVVAITVGLFSFTTVAEAKSPPPGVAGSDVKANVLLSLDVSGSMSWSVGAQIQYPRDIDYDSAGNLYIVTYSEGIVKYNSAGDVVTQWGGTYGDDNGEMRYPYSVAIDSNDNVYISDGSNGRVQKFDSNGTYLSQFDVTTYYSRGIAVDSADNIYVVNSNGRVEKYTSSGTYVATWSNASGYYLDIDASDNVYVAAYSSTDINKYDVDGNLLQSYGVSINPYGIAVDSNGDMYVTRYSSSGRVYGYDSSGSSLADSSWSGFYYPRGMAFDNSGNLTISDYFNQRITNLDGDDLITVESRLDQMKLVIKNLVSDSDLTGGANFGLISWENSSHMEVEISTSGASDIYNMIDDLTAGGGTYPYYAMDMAQDYFDGNGYDSPLIDGAECQNTIIIMISDGEWYGSGADTIAATLFANDGIKTFALGFLTLDSQNYVDISIAGGTYPDSPFYGDNYQEVSDMLKTYILQAIDSDLTFTAPTIVPGIENDDHILQSIFNYRADNQWKGSLIKYSLTDDGLLGSSVWDAGVQLNAISSSDRQIWTVGNGMTAGLNNFVDTNFADLRTMMEENLGTSLGDSALMDLINFIRGEDVYNEYPTGIDEDGVTLYSGDRWKLADIYHSRASVVGAPNAYSAGDVDTDSETYYRYVNGYINFKSSNICGAVCSEREEMIYVGSNGGMLHALESADGDEKWAFIPPSVLANFPSAISLNAAESTSFYGVDGSPTIKDIYYGGQWHTVLISGLRQGGHSYFALDVTDPTSPTHLFTFSYNTSSNKVHYWAADGSETSYDVGVDTIPAEYDFSDLGESWSQPVIIKAPVGTAGADKWVALIGGGFNSGINSTYGSRLFIIDLEDGGKILQKITITDNDGSNNIVNAVPPRVTAITADSTTLMGANGALVYFTDIEGNMWKVNLTDQGTLYDATAQFDNEGTLSNGRLAAFGTEASINSDYVLTNIYGTGNILQLGEISADIENRVYGIFDRQFPAQSVIPQFTASSLQDVSLAGVDCPSNLQNGWMFDLDSNEKITARMTVKNGLVFVPRFTPDAGDVCEAGNGRLTQHTLSCGAETDDTDLGDGMPTEAVVYKNKIYIGISNSEDTALAAGFTKTGNLIVGTPSTITTGTVNIESWWEDF